MDQYFTAKLDMSIISGALDLDIEASAREEQLEFVQNITYIVAKDSLTDHLEV